MRRAAQTALACAASDARTGLVVTPLGQGVAGTLLFAAPGCAPRVPGTPQRDPEVFLLAKCFLEAWGTKAERPQIFQKQMLFKPRRRRRQGQQTIPFLKMCGFLSLVPQASKKPLGQKTTSGSL